LSAKQDKQWADSLICTPHTQPKSPTKPRRSPRSTTAGPCAVIPKASTPVPFKIRELVNSENVFESLNSFLTVDLSAFSNSKEAASSCQPSDTCEPPDPSSSHMKQVASSS